MRYPLRFEHLILNKVAEGDTTLRLSVLRLTHQDGRMCQYLSYYDQLRMYMSPSYMMNNITYLSDQIHAGLVRSYMFVDNMPTNPDGVCKS